MEESNALKGIIIESPDKLKNESNSLSYYDKIQRKRDRKAAILKKRTGI